MKQYCQSSPKGAAAFLRKSRAPTQKTSQGAFLQQARRALNNNNSIMRIGAAIVIGLLLTLCAPSPALAQGRDLTNTTWAGWHPFAGVQATANIQCFSGTPGGRVTFGYVNPDGERKIAFEGTYDGKNLKLSEPNPNTRTGEYHIVTARLSDDGTRISGTETYHDDRGVDETEPFELTRAGAPPSKTSSLEVGLACNTDNLEGTGEVICAASSTNRSPNARIVYEWKFDGSLQAGVSGNE